MAAQLKVVDDSHSGTGVSTVDNPKQQPPTDKSKQEAGSFTKLCQNCGRKHDLRRREYCPAFGKTCNKCQKRNHFAAKCWSKTSPGVNPVAVSGEVKGDEKDEEAYEAHSGGNVDDSQLITMRLASSSHIRFQVDTGAQCNVLTLEIYKRATKDWGLIHVTPSRMNITAYGGTKLPVVGDVQLRVWRGESHCQLECKLVDRPDIHPLLGRKACIEMKIISYLYNDQLNQPQTGGAPVYAVEGVGLLSVQQLSEMYPTVFGSGVGRLEGQYHIKVDNMILAVQHAPRQMALRELLQKTLSDLTQQGIVSPVQEPTPWISSMVIVPKKDGSLRICLDPKTSTVPFSGNTILSQPSRT